MFKTKIISRNSRGSLESTIDDFLKDKFSVKDISYNVHYNPDEGEIIYSILILYEV